MDKIRSYQFCKARLSILVLVSAFQDIFATFRYDYIIYLLTGGFFITATSNDQINLGKRLDNYGSNKKPTIAVKQNVC